MEMNHSVHSMEDTDSLETVTSLDSNDLNPGKIRAAQRTAIGLIGFHRSDAKSRCNEESAFRRRLGPQIGDQKGKMGSRRDAAEFDVIGAD